ncbi:MAG: FG-GAP repeat domain-containing protein [Microthrixaceae bacterium]
MTLSRYDEWTGVTSPDTNANRNYGLYAFRNPSTTYPRAFWHPGIGIWQYDSAGVGAPFTAAERIDVSAVARDVASRMAGAWCAATGTAAQRRQAAWQPWWAGDPSCSGCETAYQDLVATGGPSLVSGISATGGMVQRSCTIDAGPAEPCWFVDPAVAEGATGWRFQPDGYGDPTRAPTPLSYPFYVLKRGGYEERHWLRADTLYSIDISGRRLLGKNARPRDSQAGSGLTWASYSGLCDLATGKGACDAHPPEGKTYRSLDIVGTRTDLVGDINGDGRDDIVWYGRGSTPDQVWLGQADGSFTAVPFSISGDYEPLIGDIDGDAKAEIVWYGVGSVPDYVSEWTGSTFTAVPFSANGVYVPVLADLFGDGSSRVIWYAPGTPADYLSTWSGTTFTAAPLDIRGQYHPITGQFDAGGQDVLWVDPTAKPDPFWHG